MKFLRKDPDSPILKKSKVYGHDALKNRALRNELLKEHPLTPNVYCRLTLNISNPAIKYKDDFFNYYAVLPWANRAKLRRSYDGSSFFQNPEVLHERLTYRDDEFHPRNAEDKEASNLIQFLGLNDEELLVHRKAHIGRLKEVMEYLCEADRDRFFAYLTKHRPELSFPTAIEAEFNIDLTDIIQNP
ncbi:MAG: hypothetical protein IPN95_22150 [Bacteroidetes bacterium]|nr:hypothetical protein [Bacteroidota bacterium]